MTLQASVGELVQIQFPVFDVDGLTPVTGYVDGDFIKTLLVDNVVATPTMTVVEIGATGHYVMEFTPDGDGLWYAQVQTPIEDVFADQVEVGPLPDDVIESIVEGVWSELLAGTYPVNSAGWRLARADDNAQALSDALIMGVFAVTGGTPAEIETDATKADGFYDDLTVVVRNADGNVSRRIVSYKQTDGVFSFGDDELPFTPAAGDEVIVLGVLGKVACENDVMLERLIEIWQRLGLDPDNPLCIKKTSHEANGWKLTHSTVGDKIIVQRSDT